MKRAIHCAASRPATVTTWPICGRIQETSFAFFLWKEIAFYACVNERETGAFHYTALKNVALQYECTILYGCDTMAILFL